jgi:hypothetical protein
MSRRIDLDDDGIIAEYDRGDSPNVIGGRRGVHGDTIRRRLRELGVTLRTQRAGQKARYSRHGDVVGLANELGLSEQEARDLLIRHGFLDGGTA